MATGSVGRNAAGIANRAVGKATGDGTPLSVTLGFKPLSLKVVNVTDGKSFEYIEGMAVSTTVTEAGAADTSGAITAVEKGFILSAAVNGNGKLLVWHAN